MSIRAGGGLDSSTDLGLGRADEILPIHLCEAAAVEAAVPLMQVTDGEEAECLGSQAAAVNELSLRALDVVARVARESAVLTQAKVNIALSQGFIWCFDILRVASRIICVDILSVSRP